MWTFSPLSGEVDIQQSREGSEEEVSNERNKWSTLSSSLEPSGPLFSLGTMASRVWSLLGKKQTADGHTWHGLKKCRINESVGPWDTIWTSKLGGESRSDYKFMKGSTLTKGL